MVRSASFLYTGLEVSRHIGQRPVGETITMFLQCNLFPKPVPSCRPCHVGAKSYQQSEVVLVDLIITLHVEEHICTTRYADTTSISLLSPLAEVT